MANHDVLIDWNNGDPSWKGGSRPAAIKLDKNDTVTLKWENVPSGTPVGFDEVLFYHNTTDANGKDAKDQANPAGSWTLADGPSNLTNFEVSATGSELTIADKESPSANDKFWYGVELVFGADSKTKKLDPELINKKKKTS